MKKLVNRICSNYALLEKKCLLYEAIWTSDVYSNHQNTSRTPKYDLYFLSPCVIFYHSFTLSKHFIFLFFHLPSNSIDWDTVVFVNF